MIPYASSASPLSAKLWLAAAANATPALACWGAFHDHDRSRSALVRVIDSVASDLNNGPAENPPLLQLNAGLLDLLKGIPVGYQLRQRELVLTYPLKEKREIRVGFCCTEAPAIVALVEENFFHVDRDIGDGNPQEHRRSALVIGSWPALLDRPENLECGGRRAYRIHGIVNSAWVDRPN